MMRLSLCLLLLFAVAGCRGAWWSDDEGPVQGIPASFNNDTRLLNSGTVAQFKTRRPNLVVAVVTDANWTPDALGYNDTTSNWDLFVFYVGATLGFACGPACVGAVRRPGLKWDLARQLTESNYWRDVRARYRRIMLADGDLRAPPCALSAVFDASAAFGLLLAQPSVCQADGSYARQEVAYQRPDSVLRFTNYASLLAPAFEMEFFEQHVAPGLGGAQTGLGLDWCWPHRLGYPQDRIAVIDSVCVSHPVDPARLVEPAVPDGRQRPFDCSKAATDARCAGGLYAAALERTGRTAASEQRAHWEACGYSKAAAEAAGQEFQRPRAFGSVERGSRRPAAVGLTARVAACQAGLPRTLAETRASFLLSQQQQAAAAAGQGGGWGHAPLLLATVALAPLAVAAAVWLWRRASRPAGAQRLPF
eukprot:scaffold28.g7548.t1